MFWRFNGDELKVENPLFEKSRGLSSSLCKVNLFFPSVEALMPVTFDVFPEGLKVKKILKGANLIKWWTTLSIICNFQCVQDVSWNSGGDWIGVCPMFDSISCTW